MSFLREHPLGAVALGVVLGIVFAQQIKKLPLVNKVPTV